VLLRSTPMKPHPEITPWFFATWIVLGIWGLWSTYIDKNIARKKRLLPVSIVGSGALFVIFVFLISGDLRVLAFMVPAVVLITFLNLRMIKVCPTCGRTIHSGMWFTRAEYCSKCGGRLN
jgi:hypothetical protein